MVTREAEQHAERPGCDLGVHLHAVLECLTGPVQHVTPQVRKSGRLNHPERHRPVDLGPQPGYPVEFAHADIGGTLAGNPRGRHLEDGPATRGHRSSETEEFRLGGVGAGHRLAIDRTVALCPRSRETKRPSFDRLLNDSGHHGDVVVGGILVAGAALTHRIAAHRTVGDLRAVIYCEAALLDGVQVLREALPLPGDALRERGARDVLDALHQLDQPLLTTGSHRREAHTAVPADHRRDTVHARRFQGLVPADLAVIVGVDVDESWGHDPAGGVDGLGGLTVESRIVAGTPAHLHDPAVLDADVGADTGRHPFRRRRSRR